MAPTRPTNGYHLAVRTRRPWCALLSLLAGSLACANVPPSSVEHHVYALREPHGACAAGSFVGTPPHRATIMGCLRIGAVGTKFDNGEARLITVLRAKDEYDADLTDWQVTVARDGEQIMNRAMEYTPSHRDCRHLGLRCRETVADVAPLPGGIGPGTYTVRYRLMNAEAYTARVPPVELTIVLR